MNKRQSNLEVLRILAAMSIIAYHMIAQSDAFAYVKGANFYFSLAFHGGGRIACTVFVLIGAYFLTGKAFRTQRFLRLWLKTVCVCIFVTISVLFLCPSILGQMNTKDIMQQFMPMVGKPYWFVQNYLALLLISPLLNMFLRYNKQSESFFKTIIWIGFFMMAKNTIFPFLFEKSFFSNEFIWFCWLYLFVGWYKEKQNHFVKVSTKAYLAVAILSYAGMLVACAWLNHIKENWPYAWEIRFYYLNYFPTIPNFLCAVSLFLFFLNIGRKQSKEELVFYSRREKLINWIGSHTFGVYLVHAVPCLYVIQQDLIWNDFFHLNDLFDSSFFPFRCIVVLIIVFTFGIISDVLCEWIIKMLMRTKYLQQFCDWGDRLGREIDNC